ncbi:MAG: GNAT family N-acetyltransferase [candidate division Zixibacteria bacterium]|nr:GNAT family N-acetyltransferase [candidate division Zixibacteria bacterium]
MSLKIKTIQSFDDFLKLKPAWNELAAATEIDHAFMRHEWFECWINNLGRRDDLLILTAWRDGQLTAVAPLQLVRARVKGIPARVLAFLASGISPRCNFIMHPSANPEEFFDALFQIKGPDLVVTRGLEAETGITRTYLDYLKNHLRGKYHVEPGRHSPYLLAEPDWDSFRKTLPRQFRTNLTTRLNKLQKESSFEVCKVTDFQKLNTIFDELVDVSARSWKGEAGTDLKSSPEQCSFYREFSRDAAQAGLWEVWGLRVNGILTAFEYCLKGKKSLSAIRTDMDPEYQKLGPGNSLKVFMIQDLMNREGTWEYDLGGMAYDYKLRWTNLVRKHIVVTASAGTVRGNLLIFGKNKLLPLLRRQKEEN